MKKILIILFFFPLFANAQCNEKTKELVDSLKSSIPYPKFNIGDVLFVAFINDPEVGINEAKEEDVDVMKVQIVNMRAYNDLAGPESSYVLSINGAFPIKWQCQFIDTSIQSPKYRDLSGFYSEDRFFSTAIEAKQSLINPE